MKNNQAGGVITFVIVAVALAALLGGGLYLSKQAGRTARNDNAPTVTVTTPDKKTESAEKKTDETQSNTGTTEQTKPAQQNTPATNSQSTSSTSTNRVATTGPSDSLPATGPKETFASIVALSGLTFAVYMLAQARSSRLRAELRR